MEHSNGSTKGPLDDSFRRTSEELLGVNQPKPWAKKSEDAVVAALNLGKDELKKEKAQREKE